MKRIEKLPKTSSYIDAEYSHLVESKINEIIDELNARCPLPDVEENFWEQLSNEFYESKLAHDYKDGKIDYRIIHQWFISHNISK